MPKDREKLAYAIFLAFIAIFVIVALKGLAAPQPGDENAYYYMGRLVSEGKSPYSDFFYAHPPLHIYLIALIYKIFGFNIIALKLIPLLSALASALFVFKITKEKFGNASALISSALFLFSYSIMFNSVFSFGIMPAVMFLTAGAYFLWIKNNCILAGMLFGLAGITRLLSLVPILIILIVFLFAKEKGFLKLLCAFSLVFLVTNGIFIALHKDSYLIPVYKFHLLKSSDSGENFREYADTLKLNWLLFLSAALLIFVKGKKQAGAFALVAAAHLLFLLALKKIFGFYFIIAFPFLAIIGGHSIANLYNKINLSKKWKRTILIILLVIFAWDLTANILFLEKIGFKGFERKDGLMEFIESSSGNDTLLFGDDSVVPLLALLTNKKIALELVDTNNQVFITGMKDLNKALNDLKGKDILFIIRNKQGISYFKEVRSFLDKNCGFLSQFHDKIEGDYIVYRCR